MKKIMTPKHSGFTIIELAIALTIVALIVGGLAIPLSTRIAEQQYTDTQVSIDKAMEALVGFAVNNRRLPCPDVNTAAVDNRDGLEDATLNAAGAVTGCSAGSLGTQSQADAASWGDIPWRSLGLQPPNNEDAWNNRLRYAVFTPLTTQAIGAAPVVCATGVSVAAIPATTAVGLSNITCQTQKPYAPLLPGSGITAALDIRCANPIAAPGTPAPSCLLGPAPSTANNNFIVAQNAIFVIYSHGANGWGATNARDLTSGKPYLAGQTSNDDLENISEAQGAGFADAAINARRRFVVRSRSDSTSNAGEFDDVLSFMSSNTLRSKLSAAGVWP